MERCSGFVAQLKKIKALQNQVIQELNDFFNLQADILSNIPDKSRKLVDLYNSRKALAKEFWELSDDYNCLRVKAKNYIAVDDEEPRENEVTVSIREIVAKTEKFYKKYGIELPDDFAEIAKWIFIDHYDEISQAIATYGYDHILIMPGTLPQLNALDAKMTKGYESTYQCGKIDGLPRGLDSLVSSDGRRGSNFRLVLVHKNNGGGDIDNNPLLASTQGLSPMELSGLPISDLAYDINLRWSIEIDFKTENLQFGDNKDKLTDRVKARGLSLDEYYVLQRQYYDETGDNLDKYGFNWLLATFGVESDGTENIATVNWDTVDDHQRLYVDLVHPSTKENAYHCRFGHTFT